MRIAAAMPTYFRPIGLERALDSLYSENPEIDTILVIDPGDLVAETIAKKRKIAYVVAPPKTRAPVLWNLALSFQPDYDAYILGADDMAYLPGWWKAVSDALPKINNSGLVGFNDDFYDGDAVHWATHYLATRDFIVQYGGGALYPPCYRHYGGDPEMSWRAYAVGKFIWAKDAHVLHQLAEGDKDWRSESREWWGDATHVEMMEEGKKMLDERRAQGFPNTWEPALR